MSLIRAISARLYAVVISFQLTLLSLRERLIQGLCALLVFLLPGIVHADGDLADMMDSAAAGAKRGKTSGLDIAQTIGVFLFIVSLLAFKKVGTQPNVTLGRCTLGVIIGALLVVVPELMSRTQKQMGTSATTIS